MTDAPQILEMSQRILAELDELRFDNIFALLNTVADVRGADEELEGFCTSVAELIGKGLVVMSMEGFFPRSVERLSMSAALEACKTLREWFAYDGKSGYWDSSKGASHLIRVPNLIITAPGLALADKLLNERGYQWWRSRT